MRIWRPVQGAHANREQVGDDPAFSGDIERINFRKVLRNEAATQEAWIYRQLLSEVRVVVHNDGGCLSLTTIACFLETQGDVARDMMSIARSRRDDRETKQ
jgi:hypothetical protein